MSEDARHSVKKPMEQVFNSGDIVRFKRRNMDAMEIHLILFLFETGLLGNGAYRVVETKSANDGSQTLKLAIVDNLGELIGELGGEWNTRWFEKVPEKETVRGLSNRMTIR